ncbi:hypothetical protein GQ44DRAFT_720305 [Phaeosphaeriaceae sp. PMI808]|nr:hypothetical protein GQ44DRAFT_720830 [Phaeosphaeriaceae sp. PMI808]KAH8690378.1 hypothetical protein GQ44DRAFT_720305 [Phaeosphaeriaceae sp. PMI808]
MDAEVAKTDRTGWYNRTDWPEHLAKRNLVHLAHQIRVPDRDEVKLQRVQKLVELLIERSVAGLSTLARETSDVIGLDWSWIRASIQSSPESRKFQIQLQIYHIRFSVYLIRFSFGSGEVLQSNPSKSNPKRLQSNNITAGNKTMAKERSAV